MESREMSRIVRPDGRSDGFTLIEVLVSLVILSAGILGIAQVFGFSLRAGNSSFQQTIVRTQSLDMAERMWFDLSDPLTQVNDWMNDHAGSLPGWSGTVAADASDPNLYTITVEWSGASADASEYTYFLRLPAVSP